MQPNAKPTPPPAVNKSHIKACNTCECRTINQRLVDKTSEIAEAAAETQQLADKSKQIASDGDELVVTAKAERASRSPDRISQALKAKRDSQPPTK